MMILPIFNKISTPRFCLVCLLLCNFMNVGVEAAVDVNDPSQGVCNAGQDSSSCTSSKDDARERPSVMMSSHSDPDYSKDKKERAEPDSLLHRSMHGLETVMDKMASSSDQMMHDMIEKMSESRAKMMAGLDSMMDKMSESRTKVMKGLDAMMEKVAKTKKQMMEGFDNVMDQVSHSKMMEEFDLILESIKESKLLMELRALPEEIRQSFILSARNRSFIVAGILVSITSAVLLGGAIYYAWCHHDAWSYYIGTIDEAKALLKQYNESCLLGRSRTTSEDRTSDNGTTKENVMADNKNRHKENGVGDRNSLENDDINLTQLGNENRANKSDFDDEDDDVFEDYVHTTVDNQNGSVANK